jgi:hypothetical protein
VSNWMRMKVQRYGLKRSPSSLIFYLSSFIRAAGHRQHGFCRPRHHTDLKEENVKSYSS